jgi:uncharacterized protein YcfL
MKKGFLVLIAVFFLAGCGATAKQSGYYEHNTLYQSWNHLKYSWCGYQSTTVADAEKSKAEGWWGIPAGEVKK